MSHYRWAGFRGFFSACWWQNSQHLKRDINISKISYNLHQLMLDLWGLRWRQRYRALLLPWCNVWQRNAQPSQDEHMRAHLAVKDTKAAGIREVRGAGNNCCTDQIKQDDLIVISHISNFYETMTTNAIHAFGLERVPTFIPHMLAWVCLCVCNCRCILRWQRRCVWHSCPFWPCVPTALRPWPTAHLWLDFTQGPKLFLHLSSLICDSILRSIDLSYSSWLTIALQ